MQQIRFIKKFILPHAPVYLCGVLLLIVINGLQLWVPKLIGAAIDDVVADKVHLATYIVEILALGILLFFLRYVSRICLLGEIRKCEYRIREAVVRKAVFLPMEFYEKHGPGKIMALLINDVTSIRVALGLGMLLFIDAVFLNGFTIWMMSHQVSGSLAALILFPMPLILVAAIVLGRVVRKRFRRVQELFSDLTEYTQELFFGLRIIQSLVEEEAVIRRFQKINQDNLQGNVRLAKIQALYIPMARILPLICYAISLFVCGRLVLSEEITIGDFVAINGYIGLLIFATMGIGAMISVMNKALGSYDRLVAFLTQDIEDTQTTEDRRGEVIPAPSIQIEGLTYAYPETETPVLEDIHIHIPAGSFVGIVGAPGSGKSTLFKLLLRLYEPPRGSIFLSGQDITEWGTEKVRDYFAYVPQESVLFSKTVAENIIFPADLEHSSAPRLQEVTQAAQIEVALEHRLNRKASKLKEAGADLSGGQQQRVAIARALYKNAPIILLDDAFSALDYETAAAIEDMIWQLRAQKTIIFISQRVTALEHADRIYVLSEGRLVEEGTHEELWQLQGEYYRLYHLQKE